MQIPLKNVCAFVDRIVVAERGPVYLHELLSGSRLILPTLLPLPRVRPLHWHSLPV